MRTELPTQGYEVHLPVSVWTTNLSQGQGVTECMSSRDVHIAVDNSVAIELGGPVILFVNLPSEVTAGNKVQLRASGRVVCVERGPFPHGGGLNVVVAMDWYDFVRADSSKAQRLLDPCVHSENSQRQALAARSARVS